MTIDKQQLREEFQYMQDHYSDPADCDRQKIYIAAEALLDELEATEKLNAELVHNHRVHAARLIDERGQLKQRIAQLEAREEALRPVGVMSEKAFHRLEGSESRFIALWPRPGIYLPRKRPEDGVIVYARTASADSIKGSE